MTVLVVAGFTRRAATTHTHTTGLTVNTPAVITALRDLSAARAAFATAKGAVHVGRRGAARKLADAEQAKDLAFADLERAVRAANPDADEPAIQAATHHLAR